MNMMVTHRKLLDLAKAQTREIELMREELVRLRARTFPSFAQLSGVYRVGAGASAHAHARACACACARAVEGVVWVVWVCEVGREQDLIDYMTPTSPPCARVLTKRMPPICLSFRSSPRASRRGLLGY